MSTETDPKNVSNIGFSEVFLSHLPTSVQVETVPLSLGHPHVSPTWRTMSLGKKKGSATLNKL